MAEVDAVKGATRADDSASARIVIPNALNIRNLKSEGAIFFNKGVISVIELMVSCYGAKLAKNFKPSNYRCCAQLCLVQEPDFMPWPFSESAIIHCN